MAQMADACSDESSDEEQLQLDYEEACCDVKDMQNELRASVIEAQQLGMRLEAIAHKAGISRSAPTAMPASGLPTVEDQRVAEIRGVIDWLATHVNLEQTQILDVGFEVPIGGRCIQLRRVAQWPLATAPGGKLRLSAPIEHQAHIAALLSATKAQGRVDPERLRIFAAAWDLVVGDFTTAMHSHPEPSVLLAHRGSPQGILIATWPTQEALQRFQATQAVGQQSASTQPPCAPRQFVVRIGDRVEVHFEGRWYVGILHSVDANGEANVMCDTDAPGVFTIAPFCSVRPLPASVPVTRVPVDNQNRRRFLTQECQANAGVAPTESRGSDAAVKKKNSAGHRRTQSSAL